MSLHEATFLALIIVVFILSLVVYDSFFRKEKDKRDKVLGMASDAMLIALISVMSFVPNMGYIKVVPGLSLTLVHIPVLIGAYLGGGRKGFVLGLYFGITSWINAVMDPTGFNALFVNPLASIPSRAVFGLLSGLLFSLLRNLHKKGLKGIYFPLGCFGLTVLHTGLVFLNLFAVHPNEIISFFSSKEIAAPALGITAAAIIGIGMILEAILSSIIVPLVGKAVNKALPGRF